MKITNIHINSFGNLENKDLNFSDNINLIYGKNESGKSTLLKFITNMFYGTSKNKKGRFQSDYDRFKPWNKEDFSGKLSYKLDSGNNFEVYREFGKKNPKIYNENSEEISKQFNTDKSNGCQFFIDQTNVDEDMFMSTFVSMQQEVKLDTQSQNILIQKIANLAGSGEDSVSFKKTIDKLNKKQLEEIGTNRSQGKPINIVMSKLRELTDTQNELLKYQNLKYEFEEKRNQIESEIEIDESKFSILKDLKNLISAEKIEKEKLNYTQNLIKENNLTLDNLKKEKASLNISNVQSNIQEKKYSNMPCTLLILLAIIITILGVYFISNNILKFIPAIISIFIALIFNFKHYKKVNKLKKQTHELHKQTAEKNELVKHKVESINAQMEILEKNIQDQNNIILQINTHINSEILKQKDNLKNKYSNVLNSEDIYSLLNTNNVTYDLDKIQSTINDKKLELHRIQLNQDNILPQLDNLAKIEEELITYKEEYNELVNKNNALNLAKQYLQVAYEKMKNSVTPKFTNNLSNNISKISNNKYNKININDEQGLIVQLPNRDYISAEQLSLGTIDQLYLSLRLSMINDISEEDLPIILDESFAYYDDERLSNVLGYLAENYKNKQVFILTCTSREEKVFNDLHIKYNKINL